MHTGLEDYAWDIPKLAAYFAERARGGVGLIVTGGYAPTRRGWLKPFASDLTTRLQSERHKQVTVAARVQHLERDGALGFVDRTVPAQRNVDQQVERTATAA